MPRSLVVVVITVCSVNTVFAVLAYVSGIRNYIVIIISIKLVLIGVTCHKNSVWAFYTVMMINMAEMVMM